MAKTVRNVMASVSPERQKTGLTMEEIRRLFMMAGYGTTKMAKRTRELLESAQIQSDGRTNEEGQRLFFCIYWPNSGMECDLSRVGSCMYQDHNHTDLIRLDGRENAWNLSE